MPMLMPRWDYNTVSDAVRRNSFSMEALGVLLVILGVLALCFVVVASFVKIYVIGALMLAAGVGEIVGTLLYWRRRRGGWVFGLILGGLYAVAGFYCLTNPETSLTFFTFALACLFISAGVARIAVNLSERFPGWGWGVADGVADLALGVVILALWPGASLVILGTLLGIQLIMAGTSGLLINMAVLRQLAPGAEGSPPARPATRVEH